MGFETGNDSMGFVGEPEFVDRPTLVDWREAVHSPTFVDWMSGVWTREDSQKA
jgi:hypothetical protein